MTDGQVKLHQKHAFAYRVRREIRRGGQIRHGIRDAQTHTAHPVLHKCQCVIIKRRAVYA